MDIAYHAAVDRDGNIYQLRDYNIAGDTATDYDTTGHYLVLAEGNFDEEAVSEAQLRGTALVFAWAVKNFGIGVDTLASHREVAPGPSCPGKNLEAHMTSGDLRARIADLLATGFDLQPQLGPAADERRRDRGWALSCNSSCPDTKTDQASRPGTFSVELPGNRT